MHRRYGSTQSLGAEGVIPILGLMEQGEEQIPEPTKRQPPSPTGVVSHGKSREDQQPDVSPKSLLAALPMVQ